LTLPSFLALLPLPPISTLFPYTTLFRSISCPEAKPAPTIIPTNALPIFSTRNIFIPLSYYLYKVTILPLHSLYIYVLYKNTFHRSEEHTSELQSRFDLECRLLLEKKNKI